MTSKKPQPDAQRYNPLTPEEEEVILRGGTEEPFSGEYVEVFADGVFACRRCGIILYRSADKFDAGCGWPAFDDEVPGAVRRRPDADGRRTEILCNGCDGHLGHVFHGEGHTPKDTRHCVNSLSIRFVPAARLRLGRAVFAGGCFWGVEYHLQRETGVVSTVPGYAGGSVARPTYEQVRAGDTGHLEAVDVLFDPGRSGFETLARVFFEIHDPTQADGQGPDIGEQYCSAIFCLDREQRAVAERLLRELRSRGLDVRTRLLSLERFWPAEECHHSYYRRRGEMPVCHTRVRRW